VLFSFDQRNVFYLREFAMFAVVLTGGKQYRVEMGTIIRVEKLLANVGDNIKLDQVLMMGDGKKVTVGAPVVEGATVEASVLDQMRDKKIIVFKKKRRHNYRRKKGHRQHLTVLKISAISAGKKAIAE
jgi:large subunit ribosomal protein L21